MKHIPLPVEHIKAESLLTTFLTTCSDVFIEPQGVFSRNYNNDVISLEMSDEINKKLTLKTSRDSLFHILPEGLFFVENVLRELAKKNNVEKFKQEEERITKEKQKIRLFFQPFDTVYFKLRFELEKKLNKLSASRHQILFDELFDVFSLQSDNTLIRKVKPLIILASEIRGNLYLMKDALKAVFFPAKIELFTIKRRRDSGEMRSILKINVHIENLSAVQFRNLKKEGDEFAQFFYEWFIPVDLDYEFKIKDTKQRFILGKAMTLDYNTYI